MEENGTWRTQHEAKEAAAEEDAEAAVEGAAKGPGAVQGDAEEATAALAEEGEGRRKKGARPRWTCSC